MPDDSIPFIPTDQKEKMALYVRGRLYDRWTSARVTLLVDAPFQEFQFSVSEPIDTHFDWDSWHIVVGDPVKVLVGGQVAINGFIDIREAFYDANSHGVMFYGRTYPANAYESSVRMEGGECQLINATFTQIMQRALQGSGTSISAPDDDGTIFPNFSISFGETPWNVGERLKRYIPALRITCDALNNTWEARTAFRPAGGSTFIEGENIKSARATIDARMWMETVHSLGQNGNRDEYSNPKEANEVECKAQDGSLPETAKPRYYGAPMPDPATKKMACGYANHELIKRGQDIVHCTITVYSWFERSGERFKPYGRYTVHSPMLGMDSNPLWARRVQYEQSEAGSTTTIELSSLLSQSSAVHPPPSTLGSLGPGTNYAGQGVLLSSILDRGQQGSSTG